MGYHDGVARRVATAVFCGAMATGCFVDFGELQPVGGGCPREEAGEWRFDEGQGQEARSATSCNAVLLGEGPEAQPSDPAWTNDGRSCAGAALAFDGTDDRAIADVRIAHSFALDFCLFVEPDQMDIYPRVVSTEEALFDGFYVNVNVYAEEPSDMTLEVRLPGTGAPAQTETDVFVAGTRSCWRVAYDDAGDRLVHVLEAVGASYQDVGSYMKQVALEGEVHVNDAPLVLGNAFNGARPLVAVLDELRLFAGIANAPPPACAAP